MSSYQFQKLCLFNAVKKNSQLLSQFTYKTYILLIMSSYKSTILSFIIYHIMTCHLFFTWTRDIVKCPLVWLLFSKCMSIYYNNFHNFYCNLFTWVVVNSWSMRIDTVYCLQFITFDSCDTDLLTYCSTFTYWKISFQVPET